MTEDDGVRDERRELESRAFARGSAGLSAAEERRLAELRAAAGPRTAPIPPAAEDARTPTPVPVDESPEERAPITTVLAPIADGSPAAEATAEEGGEAAPVGWRTRLGALLRTDGWRRPRVVVGAALLLLALGAVIGVALPRPAGGSLPLSAEDIEHRDRTMEGRKVDPGSVLLLERKDDLRLWFATKGDSTVDCIILEAPWSDPIQACRPHGSADTGMLQASLQPQNPREGEGEGAARTYSASVLVGASGQVVGTIDSYEYQVSYDSGLSTEEKALAAALKERTEPIEGLNIVGYLDDTPVWTGSDAQGAMCLLVDDDGLVRRSCTRDWNFGARPPFSEVERRPVLRIDGTGSDAHRPYVIEYWNLWNGPSYVTITRDADAVERLRIPTLGG